MTTNRMRLEQEDDHGLSAQLEALEAMTAPGDAENQQLICLLLELKRRRANQQALEAELQEYRKASKEPVAFTEKHEISNMHATGLYLRAWPADRERNEVEGYTVALYAAPPLQAVPDAHPENDDEDGDDIDYLEPSEVYELGRKAGWNACRAAMLAATPQPSGK